MKNNEAWSAVAEIATSQHGAFNRTQARSNDLTAPRIRAGVRAGRIRQVLFDVFVFSGHPNTYRQRCSIVSLTGAAISHCSAAILHKLDGFPEQATSAVEVCFERRSERKFDGVVVHTWSDTAGDDITTVDGIRCTSIARTLFQLGSVCTRDQVEIALDSALREGASPAWIEATANRLARPGPTGGGVLFDLMQDPSREGALSESVLERLIERILTIAALPPIVRQHEVQTGSGLKRLDLAFPTIRLGIEGHSKRHHGGPRREATDSVRDAELIAAGWEIIYVTWKLAHDPASLVAIVSAAVDHRRALIRHTG